MEAPQENKEADALTNEDFSSFNQNARVHIDLSQIQFLVLPWLQDEAEALFKLVHSAKQDHSRPQRPKKKAKGSSLRIDDPW